MASTSNEQETKAINTASTSEQSLKLAVAISLLRSKLLQRQAPPENPLSESDALRWRRKAKDRKQEILRLREDLKEAEDASRCDLFPQSASCKCYFFDNLGKLSPKHVGDCSERRFSEVLRRRFLRQVRFKERRRRRDDPNQRPNFSDFNNLDEAEHLRASVDFLVDLCDTTSPAEEANFANWSHQAVDFILASLGTLLSAGKDMNLIEGIVSSLIVRLVRRMCSPARKDETRYIDTDGRFYIQHLIRKLGSESYIGQRAIFSVTQRISVAAESMLSMDPFDDAFPNMHECLFIMIQLIEFLVADNFSTWSMDGGFDKVLFEVWVTSLLNARKALELLESRNGLYVLYMERVTGELAKHVSRLSSLQQLNRDVLNELFR